jgi:hypothetical protein
MNNDYNNWNEWRNMPPRWRILIAVFVVVWTALALCGLPSHCTSSVCIARLWDFCCYLRACWTLVE